MIADANGSIKVMLKTGYREGEVSARLLPISDVARFLGVHTSTVRRWGQRGLLEPYAVGLNHNLGFRQDDVLNFSILRFFDKCQEESA